MTDKQAAADNNTMKPPIFTPSFIAADNMLNYSIHVTYHTAFRVLKKVRVKYHLTTNEVIMLNGLYVYTQLCKTEFTVHNAVRFVGYWNVAKVKYIFNNLIEKGYMYPHKAGNVVIWYRLSDNTYQLMKEIFSDYDKTIQYWYNRSNLSI